AGGGLPEIALRGRAPAAPRRPQNVDYPLRLHRVAAGGGGANHAGDRAAACVPAGVAAGGGAVDSVPAPEIRAAARTEETSSAALRCRHLPYQPGRRSVAVQPVHGPPPALRRGSDRRTDEVPERAGRAAQGVASAA